MRRRPEVIEQAIERFGKLDLMVNNAGIVNAGNAENKNTEEYRLTMEVHADGGVIPQSSESYVVAYCIARDGLSPDASSVAVHCAENKNGVRYNPIHASEIATPMVAEFGS